MSLARVAAFVAPLSGVAIVVAACSSSTILSSTDAGSSGSSGAGTSGLVERVDAADEPLPRPRAILSSKLTPSSVTREPCPFDGPYVDIGGFDPLAPVEDGSTVAGLQARVYCTVVPLDASGTAFKVFGSVDFDAKGSPSATLDGTIRTTGSSTVVFSVGKANDVFASNQCSFTLRTPAQGVAAGRVWGEVDCNEAETLTFDKLCRATAEIRFENCRQKE